MEAPRNMTRVKAKECVICGENFTPRDKAQKQLVCSPKCRQLRKAYAKKTSVGKGTGLNPDGSVKKKFLVRGNISLSTGVPSGSGSQTI